RRRPEDRGEAQDGLQMGPGNAIVADDADADRPRRAGRHRSPRPSLRIPVMMPPRLRRAPLHNLHAIFVATQQSPGKVDDDNIPLGVNDDETLEEDGYAHSDGPACCGPDRAPS